MYLGLSYHGGAGGGAKRHGCDVGNVVVMGFLMITGGAGCC